MCENACSAIAAATVAVREDLVSSKFARHTLTCKLCSGMMKVSKLDSVVWWPSEPLAHRAHAPHRNRPPGKIPFSRGFQ